MMLRGGGTLYPKVYLYFVVVGGTIRVYILRLRTVGSRVDVSPHMVVI